MRKTLVYNLILLIVTISICFIIGEVVFRYVYSFEFSLERENQLSEYGVFDKTPNFKFLYKRPGEEFAQVVETNSKGLRDYEYDYKKPKDTYRVAMVGDSFTEGYQVGFNQSIPKVTEVALQEEGKYEVINFGHGGFGFLPLAVIIEEKITDFNPDMVILVFFVGNDYTKLTTGAYKSFPEEFWDPEKHEELKKEVYGNSLKLKISSFLRRHSVLYYVYKRTFVFKNSVHNPNEDYLAYEKEYDEQLTKNVEITEKIFSFLQQDLEKRDIKFVVVLLPAKEQIVGTMPKEYELLKPQRIVKEMLEERDIAYLDLYPTIRDAQKINNTYWKVDAHLNEYGYEVAGKEIAEFMLKNYAF